MDHDMRCSGDNQANHHAISWKYHIQQTESLKPMQISREGAIDVVPKTPSDSRWHNTTITILKWNKKLNFF